MDDGMAFGIFRIWQKMEEPNWANIKYQNPNFQAIRYYTAQRQNQIEALMKWLIVENFCKMGINIETKD